MQRQNSNEQMRNLSKRFNHDLDFKMKVQRRFFFALQKLHTYMWNFIFHIIM